MARLSDPARTSLFYWLLAVVASLLISILSYGLLRLTQHGQALTALETWREARQQDVLRESTLLQHVRDTSVQHHRQLADLEEQARFLKNGLTFHEAQISYIIAWDKRMREQEDPQMRRYPR